MGGACSIPAEMEVRRDVLMPTVDEIYPCAQCKKNYEAMYARRMQADKIIYMCSKRCFDVYKGRHPGIAIMFAERKEKKEKENE